MCGEEKPPGSSGCIVGEGRLHCSGRLCISFVHRPEFADTCACSVHALRSDGCQPTHSRFCIASVLCVCLITNICNNYVGRFAVSGCLCGRLRDFCVGKAVVAEFRPVCKLSFVYDPGRLLIDSCWGLNYRLESSVLLQQTSEGL